MRNLAITQTHHPSWTAADLGCRTSATGQLVMSHRTARGDTVARAQRLVARGSGDNRSSANRTSSAAAANSAPQGAVRVEQVSAILDEGFEGLALAGLPRSGRASVIARKYRLVDTQ